MRRYFNPASILPRSSLRNETSAYDGSDASSRLTNAVASEFDIDISAIPVAANNMSE
jgi:N-acetylglucosamine kinase-like BadF-type ATPase